MSYPTNTFGHVASTFYNASAFVESAKQLAASNPAAWAGIVAAREYLREFGRAATAPDVRWRITQSVFAEYCGELRWPNPEDQAEHPDIAIRGIFVAHPSDEWYVFTVLGNKAVGKHRGNEWYDLAIKQSDQTIVRAIDVLGLAPLPRR